MNKEIFDTIFHEVGKRYNLTAWFEIFDSEVFEEVKQEIANYFRVDVDFLSIYVDGYSTWYKEMCEEL